MLVRRVWPSRPTFESSFADFEQLRHQMQRLFDAVGGANSSELATGVFPPVNVTHDQEHMYVRAEIPGVSPNELQLSTTGRRLTITGRREIASESEKASYHRKERAEGEFSRTLTLPMEFDSSKVEASYVAGVLTVTLPKHEAAKPRQISIKT